MYARPCVGACVYVDACLGARVCVFISRSFQGNCVIRSIIYIQNRKCKIIQDHIMTIASKAVGTVQSTLCEQ